MQEQFFFITILILYVLFQNMYSLKLLLALLYKLNWNYYYTVFCRLQGTTSLRPLRLPRRLWVGVNPRHPGGLPWTSLVLPFLDCWSVFIWTQPWASWKGASVLNALFIYLIVIHHFVPEILITVCLFGMREIDFLAMNLHV